MDDNLEIRLATTADMDRVMRVAILACQDNSFMDFDAGLLAAEIWPALNQDHGLFATIGPKSSSEIEGFVLLRIGKMFYSSKPCLEEKCLFVRQEYRSARGGRARKLLEFTKKTADTLGLPLIIGILSTKRQDGKVKLYERVFGQQAGAFFLYGTQCGTHQQEIN